MMVDFLTGIKQRSLLAQVTHEDELVKHLSSGKRVAYAGFDPTADSLHVGHLLPLLALARWQKAGHKAIALLGGGTALIGDPTGKTEMRQVLSQEVIQSNIDKIRIQIQKFLNLDETNGLIVNNADWLTTLNYIEMLRRVGPHFSVNRMLSAECFKSRFEKGLSFIEFNYMILQAYDFMHLHKNFQCTVQLGGDDQWSNMLAGVELIRRLNDRQQSFCITCPLLTTTDGKKMGKTEKGAVWLDPNKTSPYEYSQFWRNIPDELVEPCFMYFTFLPVEEIKELCKEKGQALNQTKKKLAFVCTQMLHGEEEAKKAESTAETLFNASSTLNLESIQTFEVSSQQLSSPQKWSDLVVGWGVFQTKSEFRRLVEQGGFTVGDHKITNGDALLSLDDFTEVSDKNLVFRKGKKHYYRVKLV